MATPSMARGGHRTPFPFLSKTDERRGGLRTPGQRNPPPIKRVLKNTRETHLVGLEPTTSGFGNQRSTN